MVEKNSTAPFAGITLQLGMFTPQAAYAERYDSATTLGVAAPLFRYSFFNFVPVLQLNYFSMSSQPSTLYVDSEMSITGLHIGLRYAKDLSLPDFITKVDYFNKPLTLFAYVTEGVSRVQFKSQLTEYVITEYINTISLGIGFSFPVYENVDLGFATDYRFIFTSGENLEGLSFNVSLGYRL